MGNILIPSGTVTFQGDYENLLHTISIANGNLTDAEHFQCTLVFPAREFHNKPVLSVWRGRIAYRFRCHYVPSDSGYEITYKVYPGDAMSFLIVIIMASLCTGIMQAAENHTLLIGSVFALLILTGIFSFSRYMCIELFKKIFTRKT